MSVSAPLGQQAALIAFKGIKAAVAPLTQLSGAERRALEIYLLVTACNVNQVTAAAVAGCTKQNVSKRMRHIEDRREAADFDALVERLERGILGV